jgi:hypothetical protein
MIGADVRAVGHDRQKQPQTITFTFNFGIVRCTLPSASPQGVHRTHIAPEQSHRHLPVEKPIAWAYSWASIIARWTVATWAFSRIGPLRTTGPVAARGSWTPNRGWSEQCRSPCDWTSMRAGHSRRLSQPAWVSALVGAIPRPVTRIDRSNVPTLTWGCDTALETHALAPAFRPLDNRHPADLPWRSSLCDVAEPCFVPECLPDPPRKGFARHQIQDLPIASLRSRAWPDRGTRGFSSPSVGDGWSQMLSRPA